MAAVLFLAAGVVSSPAVVDTGKAVVTVPVVKKAVVVPRPKTNWSKLKELFM